jgi:DNA adenine methylase
MFFPAEVNRLIEPFAGSAAITIAAAGYGKATNFHINDLNKPLIDLWREIITNPHSISDEYERLWMAQSGKEKAFYYQIRDEFNANPSPGHFLYLLARCVKASVRYNARGEFNQSPDNRRKGRNPEQMRRDIFAVSELLKNRTSLSCIDYREVLKQTTIDDLVYMDPPYQGVVAGASGDPRYYKGVSFNELVQALHVLNNRNIAYILSYDGRTGSRTYGEALPDSLHLHRIEINAGRSTQATLLGKNTITYESLYLSPALKNRLKGRALPAIIGKTRMTQLEMLADVF